ncbi:hypothetical protein C7M84_007412 [Penaeus vannamei]|uniref:Uncharacterized protein n=1 Tax=Penaeus vannamei TaxID=6689 RepID=A0A423TCI7_PENVA|nr:hypothetical protein C7M84_007412 [Penaeus vannamei]
MKPKDRTPTKQRGKRSETETNAATDTENEKVRDAFLGPLLHGLIARGKLQTRDEQAKKVMQFSPSLQERAETVWLSRITVCYFSSFHNIFFHLISPFFLEIHPFVYTSFSLPYFLPPLALSSTHHLIPLLPIPPPIPSLLNLLLLSLPLLFSHPYPHFPSHPFLNSLPIPSLSITPFLLLHRYLFLLLCSLSFLHSNFSYNPSSFSTFFYPFASPLLSLLLFSFLIICLSPHTFLSRLTPPLFLSSSLPLPLSLLLPLFSFSLIITLLNPDNPLTPFPSSHHPTSLPSLSSHSSLLPYIPLTLFLPSPIPTPPLLSSLPFLPPSHFPSPSPFFLLFPSLSPSFYPPFPFLPSLFPPIPFPLFQTFPFPFFPITSLTLLHTPSPSYLFPLPTHPFPFLPHPNPSPALAHLCIIHKQTTKGNKRPPLLNKIVYKKCAGFIEFDSPSAIVFTGFDTILRESNNISKTNVDAS